MCQAVEDFYYDSDFRSMDPDILEENHGDQFIVYFQLYGMTPSEITILVTYYMFTSLSTVGFGDYHPRSNFERVYCAMILLFGVAIFSYIMGNFIEILD